MKINKTNFNIIKKIKFINFIIFRFTSASLSKTFIDAIPFFKFNFFSMLIFSVVIFGTHNLITMLYNNRRNAKNAVSDMENSRTLFIDPINSL